MSDYTIAGMLRSAVRLYPHTTAYIDHGIEVTLRQSYEHAWSIADTLSGSLGLRDGDRFAVLAGTSLDYVAALQAAMVGPTVAVPLNTRLSAVELACIVQDSGAKVLFVDSAWSDLAQDVCKQLPAPIPTVGFGDTGADHRLDELVETSDHRRLNFPEPQEVDPALILYTGGTSGSSKGVVVSQRALAFFANQTTMQYDLLASPAVCHQMAPLFHVAGMQGVTAYPATGSTVVLRTKFDPGEVLEDVERYGVTHLAGVVTMYRMLLDYEQFRPERLSTLRSVAYGSSPMPVGLLGRLLEAFPQARISQAYGMTEAFGLVTFLSHHDHLAEEYLLGSVGRAALGYEIGVRDESGAELQPGTVGEVWARGPSLMTGYHQRPQLTTEALAGGWYHTGDIGYLDERQYLFLVDRLNDMIVTGGENVYPRQVEEAIAEHSGVASVAVFGVPSQEWGEAVHAVVIPHAGANVSEAQLLAFLDGRIASYKRPKSIEMRTEPFPMSGAMKVLKRELRAPYWKENR